jgi:hypothetical protein
MQKMTPELWEGMFRRLNAGGCPVLGDHGCRVFPVGLMIGKNPAMNFNRIFDLVEGGTGYELELFLWNELDRPIDIQGYRIELPWGTPKLSLLRAPKKSSPYFGNYVFPDGDYHDASYVLNPMFARRKSRLNADQQVDGMLVAVGEESIPAEIPDNDRAPVTLTIFDTQGNKYQAQLVARVARHALRVREWRRQRMLEMQPKRASKCGLLNSKVALGC